MTGSLGMTTLLTDADHVELSVTRFHEHMRMWVMSNADGRTKERF